MESMDFRPSARCSLALQGTERLRRGRGPGRRAVPCQPAAKCRPRKMVEMTWDPQISTVKRPRKPGILMISMDFI